MEELERNGIRDGLSWREIELESNWVGEKLNWRGIELDRA